MVDTGQSCKIGLTFADGLRSIVRQDPDVILIGEIRDAETAAIAVQSALTGHLVFSTLHTNDAPGAVTRLFDMGVEPFLLSSVLRGVVAQRLVRMLCPHCREPYLRTGRSWKNSGAPAPPTGPASRFTGPKVARTVWTRDTGAVWRFMKSCR